MKYARSWWTSWRRPGWSRRRTRSRRSGRTRRFWRPRRSSRRTFRPRSQAPDGRRLASAPAQTLSRRTRLLRLSAPGNRRRCRAGRRVAAPAVLIKIPGCIAAGDFFVLCSDIYVCAETQGKTKYLLPILNQKLSFVRIEVFDMRQDSVIFSKITESAAPLGDAFLMENKDFYQE